MIHSLEEILRAHPFFAGFRKQHLELVTGCASNRVYEPGTFLFKQGDPASDFFVLREGQVAIEISAPEKGPLVLQTTGTGDVVGWAWIVPPYIHRFDARAVNRCRVLALDGVCLRRKFDDDHELGYRLMLQFIGVITERLEGARLQLLDLYGSA